MDNSKSVPWVPVIYVRPAQTNQPAHRIPVQEGCAIQAAVHGLATQASINKAIGAVSVIRVSVLLVCTEVSVCSLQIQRVMSAATSLLIQYIRLVASHMTRIIVDGSVILISSCPEIFVLRAIHPLV